MLYRSGISQGSVDSIQRRQMKYLSKRHFHQSERKAYDPRPLTMQNTSQAELDEFRDELKELPNGTGFLHLLYKPCNTSPSLTTSPLPLIPRSVQCRMKAKLLSMPLPPSLHALQEFGEEFITPNSQQRSVEKATRMRTLA